jgi:hypothetical protein
VVFIVTKDVSESSGIIQFYEIIIIQYFLCVRWFYCISNYHSKKENNNNVYNVVMHFDFFYSFIWISITTQQTQQTNVLRDFVTS